VKWTGRNKLIVAVLLAGLTVFFLVKGLKKGADVGLFREVEVVKGDIEVTVLATGVVQPENRVDIKPPISGRVEEILVQEGARVKKGQVLARMSSTERAALLDAARAKGDEELKTWEEMYKTTPILAPINGTIIQRNLEAGQSFTSSDAVLVMSDRLIVKASVDETDIANVKVNQLATIVLDAYSDKPMEAKAIRIAYDAKTVNNVTTYEVEVLPEHVPPFMRSGMTANVTFQIRSKKDILIVPKTAIRGSGKPQVWVKGPDGEKVEREVDLGESDSKMIEVVSGVNEKEILLVPEYRPGERKTGGSPFAPGQGGGRARRGGH